MAGEADVADARKPFNWEAVEDDDELSFGSEYETDADVGAEASAQQSGEHADAAGDVAARTMVEDDQPGFASPKPDAVIIKTESAKIEAVEAKLEFKSVVKADVLPHDSKSVDAKPERKAPRTPVKWTQPPTEATSDDKSLAPFGGGVRGRAAASRGMGAARTTVHKNVFNAALRAQPRARDPWPSRGRFGVHGAVMPGIGGRGVPRAQLPVERGQFMTKLQPNVPQRPHGDGMGSALDQLKTAAAPTGPAKASAMMNPGARPFKPRPPLQPPQLIHQLQPLQQPQRPLHPRPPQRPALRPQITSSLPFAFPRPVHARPSDGAAWPVIAPASTWVRGQSDSVAHMQPSSAETKAAPADSKAAQKTAKSSTWVNPNVAEPVVSRPVAAATADAPNKKEDNAVAQELRRKDEEIAQLKAKLERQVPPKRQNEDNKEDDEKISFERVPRKLFRAGEGARMARTALQSATGSDGRRVEEPSRPKGDIISRVQFNTRIRDDTVHVKEEKPFSPQLSRSMSPVHRVTDHRKEPHGRDSGRHGSQRGGDRVVHGGRQGDERRYKSDVRRVDKRQPEMSEEQKSRRVQRFGGATAR